MLQNYKEFSFIFKKQNLSIICKHCFSKSNYNLNPYNVFSKYFTQYIVVPSNSKEHHSIRFEYNSSARTEKVSLVIIDFFPILQRSRISILGESKFKRLNCSMIISICIYIFIIYPLISKSNLNRLHSHICWVVGNLCSLITHDIYMSWYLIDIYQICLTS